MKIAVTLVGIRDTNFSSVGRFIWKWLEGEIHAHPEHQFMLLSDTAQPTSFVGAPNCSWIKTRYDRSQFLAEKIWYEVTAPKLLTTLQPALWLQLSGRYSARTSIPQICFFEDNLTKFQSYFFKKSIKKVKQWLVIENKAAIRLQDQFGIQTLKGIVFQLFSHGIIVAGLLMIAEWIEKGSETLDLNKMGGFAEGKRFLPIAFMVMLLGSIALPLTSGFIGEFLLLNAVFHYNYWIGGVVAISIILGAVYMLRLYQKSMLGTNNGNVFNGDLTIKENWIIIPLMLFVIIGGIFPNWVNQFLF